MEFDKSKSIPAPDEDDSLDSDSNTDQLFKVRNVTISSQKSEAARGPDSEGRSSKGARVVSPAEQLISQGIQSEYEYATHGLIVGLAVTLGGMILAICGVVGAISWTAYLFGFHSKIIDATPGVVLFVVGIFIIFITRPKVKMSKLKS